MDLKSPQCFKKQDVGKTKKSDPDLKLWTPQASQASSHGMGGKVVKVTLVSLAQSSNRGRGKGLSSNLQQRKSS